MCSAEGCTKPIRCRGLCATHYYRLWRHENVVPHPRPLRPPSERFWEKVDKNGPVIRPELGPCWVFTGAKVPGGYGSFNSGDARVVPAHVFAWTEANGPRPDGLYICHHCDNPPCVNPAHLYAGTPTDNNHDTIDRGRRNPPRPTHCKRGHPFDAANTYVWGGCRNCLTCKAMRDKEYKRRRRVAAA